MADLDHDFWKERYDDGKTGWNIGYPSDPIVAYIDQLESKDLDILIPGAGNAYEAEHLWKLGFKNLVVIDLVEAPLKNLKSRCPDIPDAQLIQGDFFDHNGEYDLIIEQTFFCALPPSMRERYVSKMHQLLKPSGCIAGVMFKFPLTEQGPPFGGSEEEYRGYYQDGWEIRHLEECYNSIEPRMGNELFVEVFRK